MENEKTKSNQDKLEIYGNMDRALQGRTNGGEPVAVASDQWSHCHCNCRYRNLSHFLCFQVLVTQSQEFLQLQSKVHIFHSCPLDIPIHTIVSNALHSWARSDPSASGHHARLPALGLHQCLNPTSVWDFESGTLKSSPLFIYIHSHTRALRVCG